ncbi:MAG: biopolymer transporter ExbD [Azospira oryzae]|uniref:Biopolymer transporter ExbD n=1 Tax=Pelomicrobium methylotrophicum TaxID=2602750 RepID=A0A5C7EKG8_9PROT|nr:biopolymer transporter ExbD [Pelomicrobium methylotrophicum]PZP62979.1 MAG: biopolymer transporter ExbD [Azospira oryzae]PZP81888.1 MAG: biopolymer transporter ExbD [Azospira oryzae]TXF11513.1 biopolymer transporter ExbD [Pelomicrobium methylotrophicum]
MNFQRGRQKDEPRIDFVPLIDVLLVILIFLMVTTTYSRFSELQINLPEAGAVTPAERPNEITVAVDPAGQYVVNNQPVNFTGVEALSQSLRRAAPAGAEPVVVIAADARASHQSVVNVMEAARIAGFNRITFTTRTRER